MSESEKMEMGIDEGKEDMPGGLSISVSVKDTELFKNYLEMMKDMLTDERIDKRVREEYYHRYLSEVEEVEKDIVEGKSKEKPIGVVSEFMKEEGEGGL